MSKSSSASSSSSSSSPPSTVAAVWVVVFSQYDPDSHECVMTTHAFVNKTSARRCLRDRLILELEARKDSEYIMTDDEGDSPEDASDDAFIAWIKMRDGRILLKPRTLASLALLKEELRSLVNAEDEAFDWHIGRVIPQNTDGSAKRKRDTDDDDDDDADDDDEDDDDDDDGEDDTDSEDEQPAPVVVKKQPAPGVAKKQPAPVVAKKQPAKKQKK